MPISHYVVKVFHVNREIRHGKQWLKTQPNLSKRFNYVLEATCIACKQTVIIAVSNTHLTMQKNREV